MGRIIGSRGSTSSGNIASYQNIICQSAYLSNEVPGIDNQGLTANFEAIDIISISGVEYYAARARPSGGPCDNGLYFEGFMVNNTGDTNVFTATRASTAGVSVITTNVATLNSWVFRDTYLQAQRAGYDRLTISGTETNFNDPGLDYDFRVESDTNTHALFVDAGNSSVAVNTSSTDSNVALTVGGAKGFRLLTDAGATILSNNQYTFRAYSVADDATATKLLTGGYTYATYVIDICLLGAAGTLNSCATIWVDINETTLQSSVIGGINTSNISVEQSATEPPVGTDGKFCLIFNAQISGASYMYVRNRLGVTCAQYVITVRNTMAR
jgi:hypothetical protein